MSAESHDPHKLIRSAPDQLALAITPKGMMATAAAISETSAVVANHARATNDCVPSAYWFRTSEVAEIIGISPTQIRQWRSANKESMVAYRESADTRADYGAELPMTLGEVHRLMSDLGLRPRRPSSSRALRLGLARRAKDWGEPAVALHLSVVFARYGWRCLVIDGDAQGSLSSMLGIDPSNVEDEHTLLPAFDNTEQQPMLLKPIPTCIDGLDLLPANLSLLRVDFEIGTSFLGKGVNGGNGQDYDFVGRALKSVEDNYDLIVMVAPPTFSYYALAILSAADGMVIPFEPSVPDYKAIAAWLGMLGTIVPRVAAGSGPTRQWCPFLILHKDVDAKCPSAELVSRVSKEAFGRYRVDQAIPDTSVLRNAPQMSLWAATATMPDAHALKNARDAYCRVGTEVIAAVRSAWAAGSASACRPGPA